MISASLEPEVAPDYPRTPCDLKSGRHPRNLNFAERLWWRRRRRVALITINLTVAVRNIDYLSRHNIRIAGQPLRTVVGTLLSYDDDQLKERAVCKAAYLLDVE
jgi:hypothetical protein